MLIHLCPCITTESSRFGMQVSLIDIQSPELGLHLHGGRDVEARRPYPNKHYQVVCRKKGRLAIEGLLIECPEHVEKFTVVVRWFLNGRTRLIHRITYNVLDQDFDAVSDNMVLWMRCSFNGREYKNRWPSGAAHWTPASAQPRMTILCDDGRVGNFQDTVDQHGIVVQRTEVCYLRTIESERLSVANPFALAPLPHRSDAFKAQIAATTC